MVLTPPQEPGKANRASRRMNAARVLTSDEVALELREQAKKKKELEEAKEQRKTERERKKEEKNERKRKSTASSNSNKVSKKAAVKFCGVCKDDDDGVWITCSICTVVYHVECVGVCALNENQVARMGFWTCPMCA